MTQQLIADFLIETLENIGVKRIYGVVGDSLNAITNAIYTRKKIQWVHTRHEEAAAFAAGAEAQITGSLAVCAGSCGPGNLHLINGLYDAQRSAAPVLAIAAQIPSSEIGSHYFQETNPQHLFKDCSYFCETVTNPEQFVTLLHSAIQAAINNLGVAVIVIPGDIAVKYITTSDVYAQLSIPCPPKVIPTTTDLQHAANIINESAKITLFCGYGARDARDEVIAFADKLQSPIVHTLRGKDFMEYSNPYDVGMTGLIGFASGYFAMEESDTLILLGTSFPYRAFYPKKARIIQIDIKGENLGRKTNIELGLRGDVKYTLRALLPLIQIKKQHDALDKAVSHYKKSRKNLDALAVGKDGEKPIYPQFLAKTINTLANDDAIFTCDVGTQTAWAARYLVMNGKRRLIGSFNHGSMANALSQAIGAQAIDNKRQVIAMCGDGGFAMLMGEILTLVQYKLPIKIIILNNSALDFVQMEMFTSGYMNYGVNLTNPDFSKLATAVGIKGIRIEDPADLATGLRAAFDYNGPAIVDVVCSSFALIMPPTIKLEQAAGFGLFALKAILNGRGDLLVDLAKANLWK